MTLIPLWVKAVIVAALIGALLFCIHLYNNSIREEQRLLDKAEYDKALINAQADATAQTAAWLKKWKEKDDVTTEEIKKREDRLAVVSGINSSLRNQLANIGNSTSQLTPSTCAEGIKTLSAVFGECVERYSEMGRKAEGHLLDSEDCRAKWPTKE